MTDRQHTPAGPTRIAAFVLVALAAFVLAYLRLASGHDRVAVPAGAHAGQLTMKPCGYATERGRYAADCGTLVVRENRHARDSRLIALPVTRIRARSAHPAAPIFRLEGGPGLTNMHFADASRFAGRHDVVLVGYRGVDGSSALACPEVSSALKASADFLGTRSLAAYADAFRACADRLRAHGVDLAGYSLPERVDDLEAARRALGYGRVDLLSESAGTRTAMIYAWRHPASIRRSVMIGVNPPGHFLWSARTIDAQLARYATLCARNHACRGRTADLAATMRATAADMPDHWGPLTIKPGNVRVATFFGLMQATSSASPLSGPMTIDAWLSAAHGDRSGLWFQSLLAQVAFPNAQAFGDVAAVGRIDASDAARTFTPAARRGSVLGDPGTDFLWGGGRLLDAWPAEPDEDEYDRVRPSATETLLINGSLDFATPAQNGARELLPHLRHGHEVVLPGFGHTADFWDAQPAAGTHLVNTFFDTGAVDASRYLRTPVDFTPPATQTEIAKIIAVSLVGTALVAVLSLLWLAVRVARRGGVGRRASALLRTLFPVLSGLGGWAVAVLVVLTLAPTVAVDDEALAVGAIGAPVGLGIYWAWINRGLVARERAFGLASALGGAVSGAWLGFLAVHGLVAVFTAVMGAAVGANLALLVLDTVRDPLRPSAPNPAVPV